MRKVIKGIGLILAVLVVLIAALFGVLTLTEYRPADTEAVDVTGAADKTFAVGDSLTVLTWNTGYGALGDNADFFMDGGQMVQTADKARVEANLASMTAAALGYEPDILFLQEVDADSDRSHHIDERQAWTSALTSRAWTYATNYRVLYVPYPIPPIGHVDGGLMTLSTAQIASAERIQLPCPFSWPVRLGNLKRCLLVSRIPLSGTDRELVAINLHLEAYDDGSGKAAQTAMLTAILQTEAAKGNYVIAGGDFNQLFLGTDMSAWPVYEGRWQPGEIDPADFGAGLTALMDSRVPTCRSLDQPLAGTDTASFQFYVIDGFIVSDNVRVDSLETQSLSFTATDHNPVLMQVTLLGEQ